MQHYLLTTTDNPFHPYTQYDMWRAYDEQMGYNSGSYLARIARTSPYNSPEENERTISEAIDEIIRFNGPQIYKKVVVEI